MQKIDLQKAVLQCNCSALVVKYLNKYAVRESLVLVKLQISGLEKTFRAMFLSNKWILGYHIKDVWRRRSSPQEVFCEKGILTNFTKFTGKHLYHSPFFNKVAGLRPATLLIKRLWHKSFPVNFVKFLRTSFLTEHLWWLLLKEPCDPTESKLLHYVNYSR